MSADAGWAPPREHGDDARCEVVVLDVAGMHCGGCAGTVRKVLEAQDGVASASVNLMAEVATATVRLSHVAIAHGSLTITVTSNLNVSQPGAFSQGKTTVTPSTNTSVNETKGGFTVLNEPPTIERLAAALNALGVSTRDMMAIFQTLKRSGALQAELIIN